jgi:anaerobic magnesium-protoporphyrin IX monomethyl ester cyclase
MKISLISMDPILGAFGLRSISSCLKQSGHTTEILFMQSAVEHEKVLIKHDSIYSGKILQAVSDKVRGADLIGLSCMAVEAPKALQIVKYLGALKVPIIWGGIHATSHPDECIQYADYVCIGEGEDAVIDLVKALDEGSDTSGIPNLWTRQNGNVIKNPVRTLIQDLDVLPFPDYNFDTHYVLENDRFVSARAYYEDLQWLLVHTTRGCPMNCSYCCNSLLQKIYSNKNRRVRKTSVETVLNRLDQYKKLFPRLGKIWFTDDTFFIRTAKELREFASGYKERVALPFQCFTSPGTLNVEKLELLLDAGMLYIEMGIQSGSENTNKNIFNRNIANSTVIKAANLLFKYKDRMYPPTYQIIFQNPYETESDLMETIRLLSSLPPYYLLQVFHLTFFPGSELANRAKSDGMLKGDSLISFYNYERSFELSENEKYLNFLIYLMSGTVSADRIGHIPRSFMPVLISKGLRSYFSKSPVSLDYLIKSYFQLSPFPQNRLKRYAAFGNVALGCISRSLRKRNNKCNNSPLMQNGQHSNSETR